MKKILVISGALIIVVIIALSLGVLDLRKIDNQLTPINDEQLAEKADKDVQILVYYGNEECKSCRDFINAHSKLRMVTIYYIDSNNNQAPLFTKKHNVVAPSTLLVIQEGKIISRFEGSDAIMKMIDIYNSRFATQ